MCDTWTWGILVRSMSAQVTCRHKCLPPIVHQQLIQLYEKDNQTTTIPAVARRQQLVVLIRQQLVLLYEDNQTTVSPTA